MSEISGMLAFVGVAVGLGLLPGCPHNAADPSSAHAEASRRAEIRGAMALAVFGFGALLSLWVLVEGRPTSALIIASVGLLTAPVLYPWPLVQHVLIPLGAWRAAHALALFGGRPWLQDRSGGAVLSGVLAAMRRRRTNGRILSILQDRLTYAPLRGAGVVAAGSNLNTAPAR